MKTYVLRCSSSSWKRKSDDEIRFRVANLILSVVGDWQGVTIQSHTGVFRGVVEPGVSITIECDWSLVETILEALKTLPGVDKIHTEEHYPVTRYM